MDLHVIMATHGRPLLLERTLESLLNVHRPPGFGKFIVVENGSDAGAKDVCSDLGRTLPILYHNIGPSGKSRALQWAVDEVVGDALVVFFDDDIRVDSNVLVTYAEAAEEHGPDFVYGGPLSVDYETPPEDWLLPYLPLSAKGWEGPDSADALLDMGFFGCNYAVFGEKIRAVGGFNPDLGPGANVSGTEGNPVGQETEFQKRLFAAALTPLFLPGARVWHYVPHARCSPEWAIHRVYRERLRDAILGRNETPGRRVLGFPVGYWKLRMQLVLSPRVRSAHRDCQNGSLSHDMLDRNETSGKRIFRLSVGDLKSCMRRALSSRELRNLSDAHRQFLKQYYLAANLGQIDGRRSRK